jgi:acylphosphatase
MGSMGEPVDESGHESGANRRVTRRIRVDGRVQGIGYRYFVVIEAEALAISGWVRNLMDGSVEVLACAQADRIDVLVGRLWRGPRMAKVTAVDVTDAAPFEGCGFRVASSA